MHILIITPIFFPTTGGAATYYELLARGLLSSGEVERVTVISERLPGYVNREMDENNKIELIRLFPHRAGGAFNKLSQYVRYAIQNVKYTSLPKLIREQKPDVVLVHSGFHNFINLLAPIICQISKSFPIVADVRDHQMPLHRLRQLRHYHALIACSLNVLEHIGLFDYLTERAIHIPVLQENLLRERSGSGRTLAKYHLTSKSFFLYAGLVKPGKGIDLLISTYEVLRSRGHTEELILAGVGKDFALLKKASSVPGVRLIGGMPREELLDLMAHSRMVMNLSASEGMPRTCLEGVALGVHVLMPKGVPEFDRYCPDSVVCSSEPELVASQIEELLAAPADNRYPIHQHEISHVLTQYINLFNDVRSRFIPAIHK